MTLVRQALKEHKGSKHPVAVLVRARSHLGNLTRRLTQEGISCRAVDLVPLALRPVVADLVQLLRALSHPADRLAWLSVLRAPFCGLTLTSLQRLFGEDHVTPVPVLLEGAARTGSRRLADARERRRSTRRPLCWERTRRPARARDVLGADEYERLRQAAAVLLDARNDSGAMPFAAWVEACWRVSAARRCHGLSVANDAESLFQLVERLARTARSTWRAGSRHRAAVRRARRGGEDGAVEIMTMHKSKGLPETVILTAARAARRPGAAGALRAERRPGAVRPGQAARRDRGRSRVPLPGAARRASYEVDRCCRGRHARAQAPAPGRPCRWTTPARPSPAGRQPLAAGLADAAAAGARGRAPRAAPRTVAGRAPAPHLRRRTGAAGRPRRAQFQPGSAGARDGWGDAAEHPAWQLEAGYDAAIGTLAHAWLERIGRDGIAAWPATALASRLSAMRRQLTRAGIPASQADAAAEAVLETLQATLSDPRGQWLLSQSGARREWPLIDAAGVPSSTWRSAPRTAGSSSTTRPAVPSPGESAEAARAENGR